VNNGPFFAAIEPATQKTGLRWLLRLRMASITDTQPVPEGTAWHARRCPNSNLSIAAY